MHWRTGRSLTSATQKTPPNGSLYLQNGCKERNSTTGGVQGNPAQQSEAEEEVWVFIPHAEQFAAGM